MGLLGVDKRKTKCNYCKGPDDLIEDKSRENSMFVFLRCINPKCGVVFKVEKKTRWGDGSEKQK